MLVASTYPFINIFWAMTIFFFWVMYLYVVIATLTDNFRRGDHSGLAKAGWTIFIICVPLIGVLTYMIARPATAGEGMFG